MFEIHLGVPEMEELNFVFHGKRNDLTAGTEQQTEF